MAYVQINSRFKEEFHNICEKWLREIDEELCKYLNELTCNDIHDFYYTLFNELKKWRSNSTNFTGFSELLLFRTLYHLIEQSEGEKFKPFIDPKGFMRFKSDNYEIGQSVPIKAKEKYHKLPDISVKRNEKLISIISIKISTVDDAFIAKEIETFKSFKFKYGKIKCLLIMFVRADLKKERKEKLNKEGIETLVLQDNDTIICDVMRKFI